MEDEDQGECTGITGRTEQVIERILVKVKTLFWFSFFSGWGFQDRSIMNSCKFPCVEIVALGRGEKFAGVRYFFLKFNFFSIFFSKSRGDLGQKSCGSVRENHGKSSRMHGNPGALNQ